MWQRRFIVVLMSVFVLVLCASCINQFSMYDVSDEVTLWFKSSSPDRINTIYVEKNGEPPLLGPQKLVVYTSVKDIYTAYLLFETVLANDGKALNGENYSIEWEDNNVVRVTFIGEEQTDEVFTIKFKGKQIEYTRYQERPEIYNINPEEF